MVSSGAITIIWSFCFILEWRKRQTTRAYEKGILNTVGRGWEEARPEHFGNGLYVLSVKDQFSYGNTVSLQV